MNAGRTFISYGMALRVARATRAPVASFAAAHVGWADQADAAVGAAQLSIEAARQQPWVASSGPISAEAAVAVYLQVLAAARSLGEPVVSCEHTRDPALVSGHTLFLASPTGILFQADPFVYVCAQCLVRPHVQASIAALLPAFMDECDRCGGGGPLTTGQLQAGAVIVHYAACERCFNVARRNAFGLETGEPA